ncbi:uncharacterized protein ATC70_008131 [Mucor velutinosus]|uniref:F-box domain-containing protein n=1 Tax=Mucor velutinosus TaxID=708070 RepID=A0AAN7D8Q7_9FUNG|nr:hypothetical protein ATC70_008131 [Mucor velutinosus]
MVATTLLINFPEEIWERICSFLNFLDRFQLAMTSKKSYDIVKMIRSNIYLAVDLNDQRQSSFLVHQVEHLQISNPSVYFHDLYKVLTQFRFVNHLDLTLLDQENFNSGRFLSCIDQTRRSYKITVNPDYFKKLRIEVDFKKNKSVELIESKKRRNEEEDGGRGKGLGRRAREVSPVSEIMAPLTTSLLMYERRLRVIIAAPNDYIPSALSKFDISNEYRTMMTGLEDLCTGKALENNVSSLGSAFVESILVSNQGCYVLVTQLEVYYKDKSVDDTSINNVQLINNHHQKRPVVKTERKTAYKNAWYELKIYFKNYELLITGAVCGRFDNDQHECFLGSSSAPVTLMQQTHWLIIAPQTAVPCERDARLLQSFRNTASTNNWTFKSQNFVKKGFYTEHPLTFHENTNRVVDYFSLASYILYCGSRGVINHSQVQKCREMAETMEVWKDLGLSQKPNYNAAILEATKQSTNIGQFKKWMLQFIYGDEERDATNNELTLLYKNFLYQKLRAINDKRMKLIK